MHTKQKILKYSKERLRVVGFAVLFNVLLAGSVCGTFAWYTYATRTGFEKEYHGTTVGDMGSIQAGIISNIQLPDYANYELEEDSVTLEDENKYIYWCQSSIKAETINYILFANGSGTTVLNPVTSANYDMASDPSDFHLYRNPAYDMSYSVDPNGYASKKAYCFIPFVFRCENVEDPGNYVANESIYFSKCTVETANPEKEVYKSVRIFASNKENGFIINPTAEEDGFNKVGGILDLNEDGFYDYDSNNKEIIYGQAINSKHLFTPTQTSGTIPKEERTTFVANHKAGIYALDEETFEPETVSYVCMEKFASKVVPITTTKANYHNLACLDFYIYSEGWDYHVIDQEKGAGYNMDLKFEIDL